jgi:hypothetical protein
MMRVYIFGGNAPGFLCGSLSAKTGMKLIVASLGLWGASGHRFNHALRSSLFDRRNISRRGT